MSQPHVTVRAADQDDLDRIETLLATNDLPSGDIRDSPGQFFVAEAGEVIGVGGVEIYGSAGLVRSVAVAEPHRGEGHGAALCARVEAHARRQGVETLSLLTTTAAEFFRRRGYEEVARDLAPDAIRKTAEFADLCPSSATYMRKRL